MQGDETLTNISCSFTCEITLACGIALSHVKNIHVKIEFAVLPVKLPHVKLQVDVKNLHL